MFGAVVCAGGAVWALAVRDEAEFRARALFAGPAVRRVASWRCGAALAGAWVRGRREWGCLAAGLLVSLAGGSLLPLAGGALAVPLVQRWLRAREAARRRAEREARVLAVCAAVAGELRAGAQAGQAVTAVLRGEGDALVAGEAGVLAAAVFGGDVPGALRVAAREPGAEGLAGMAACWRVSVDGGAGLAAGLDRLERALRAEREQREGLRAQLAGARSTAVVLALLPVAGLLMGTALGAAPLRVLLHTGLGLGCLVTGLVLEGLGLCWAWRIVRAGERS
ncbi:type II secretion system F family protein [Streptomyces sp. NPDC101118]|uniref:type II secretion system F family protein n=1 Tax=Streptomyces sp. NPDC101118 TaxID=3366109 RepID=UPI0037F75B93